MHTDSEKRAAILKGIREELELSTATLKKFADSFAQHPHYALEWGDSVFFAAATEKLYREAERYLTQTQPRVIPVEDLLHSYQQELLRSSKGRRSTSTCSNLLARNHIAALGELIELIADGWVWHT